MSGRVSGNVAHALTSLRERGRGVIAARPDPARARRAPAPETTPVAVGLLERPRALPAPTAATTCPRILIVEDDPRAAGVIRETLALEGEPGWDIQVAPDGRRALELASAAPPHVVLLDVLLPGVDGAEVYRQLRANPLTARARVLFLSAATSLDLAQRGIEDGVLLRKPFDVGALAGLVRALLAA